MSYALHLFSRAVSSRLRYLMHAEDRPKENETTAWFIDLINTWFDLMSSHSPVMALSLKNKIAHHNAQLKTVARIIRSSFDERNSWKPLQTEIQLSTASVLSLAETILPSQNFLLMSRRTHDCLENVFSCIRSRSPTPSPREFKSLIKLVSVS